MPSAGLGDYLKEAFLYRWNLLFFLGGVGLAALSPWPDAALPLVGAAEIAYLGTLVSIPKFRAAIDAKVHQASRQPDAPRGATGESLLTLVNSLGPDARQRFERLRMRCLEMRQIARGVGGGQQNTAAVDLSTPALDRLLWVFLRLLLSQQAIESFLRTTNSAEIRARLEEVRGRLAAAGQDERVRRSLEDNAAVQEMRLKNYEKAQGNLEFARLELDRIEAKIQVLAESSVNHSDPDSLSNQIEGVTESVRSTETAIKELQQITGIVDQMQEPPAILEADWRRVTQ